MKRTKTTRGKKSKKLASKPRVYVALYYAYADPEFHMPRSLRTRTIMAKNRQDAEVLADDNVNNHARCHVWLFNEADAWRLIFDLHDAVEPHLKKKGK